MLLLPHVLKLRCAPVFGCVGLQLPWRFYRRKRPSIVFSNTENEVLHELLEGLNEYTDSVQMRKPGHHPLFVNENECNNDVNAPALLQLINTSHLSLFQKFVQVSDLVSSTNVTVEDSRVQPLIEAITTQESLSKITDEQLLSIIYALRLWPLTQSSKTPNFKAFWNSLDMECCRRAPNWSTTTLLKTADCWYHLRLSRITRYNSVVIRLLSRDVLSISPTVLVQLLFLINLQRDPVIPGIMDDIERALMEWSDGFSIEEISVAASGFFKSRTPLKSLKLIKAIVSKLCHNVEKLTDATLLPVLKLLRYSMTWQCKELYIHLQRKCIPLTESLSPNAIIHLALIGKREGVCHKQLLHRMVGRFMTEDLVSIRLKEFTRSVFCIALYLPEEATSTDFVCKVIEEVNKESRRTELSSYPDHLVSLLFYASYMNIYPIDLLVHCFSLEFIASIQEMASLDIHRELFALDCSVKIERPKEHFNGLPPVLRNRIYEVEKENDRSGVAHNKCLLRISSHLAQIMNSKDCIYVTQLLPHFLQKDLLLILDNGGNPKPIPTEVLTSPPGSIIKRNTDDKWVSLIVEMARQAPGKYLAKRRQLGALGFSVLVVPWSMYNSLEEDKQRQFLIDLIFPS